MVESERSTASVLPAPRLPITSTELFWRAVMVVSAQCFFVFCEKRRRKLREKMKNNDVLLLFGEREENIFFLNDYQLIIHVPMFDTMKSIDFCKVGRTAIAAASLL